MRSLFFKIFIWFWLANVLVVGVLIATIGPPHGPKPDRFFAWAGDMLELYGQQALAPLASQDAPAVRKYVEDLRERTGVQLFILDEAGRDAAGAEPPEDVVQLTSRVRRHEAEGIQPGHEGRMLVARRAAPPHEQYVFGGVLPGPPEQFFVSPYRTMLRVLSALTIAAMLCYGLAHYLTAPLRTLRASARQLAGGNLRTRVGPGVNQRHDEIGDLGHDFNFMAERLESLVSTQQRLILDISHELRSPLARLNLALELAVQRSGPAAESALERIGRETSRLNDLIERLLILARLENREAAGQRIDIDLADMLEDIVADAQFEARAHQRDARLDHCDACSIAGVPQLLRSAIENVVRNALRYTAENTAVEISLHVEPAPVGQAVVRVRDHGPGVPDDALEQIFRPFFRVGEDRNARTGGVGLGLAIARQAVSLHGGSIAATHASGGGLLVEITLPIGEEPASC